LDITEATIHIKVKLVEQHAVEMVATPPWWWRGWEWH
jgi:hypothetical protein